MKYAIDRYVVGTEKEVSANEFDGCGIPNSHKRFFCPECGEMVFFRKKGGNHPSYFFHQKKTERTPECDRRVDGRSELSLYQRVGLPIYITRNLTARYQLNIGFPPFDANMLNSASKLNSKISIIGGSHHNTIFLNHTNFIENETTLVPIDFIPENEKNYEIIISGEGVLDNLKRKLSDYADGFDKLGALFSYDETGGKKIRRGDSISTHRFYYAVVKNKLPDFRDISSDEQGYLVVGSEIYKVLKIEILASVENKSSFNAICVFFKQNFGVWLLECSPELIPIWPPTIQRDSLIPVKNKTALTCAVSSGNRKPDVYIYSNSIVHKKEIDYVVNDVNIVKINVSKSSTLLSVDRKYVGREVSVVSRDLPCSSQEYRIVLTDEDGGSFSWQEIDPKLFFKDYFIVSNAKIELIIGTSRKICKCIPIREEKTSISFTMDCDELFFVVENAVVMHFKIKNKKIIDIDTNDDFKRLQCSINSGAMVPIPRWCISVLQRFKRNNQNELYELVSSSFRNGRVHLGILKQLKIIGSHIKK